MGTESESISQLLGLGAKLGRFGEVVWERVLKSSGVHYIPLCQIDNGGAPRESGDGAVLPDYDAHAENWTAYIDSKAKTQSTVFRNARYEREKERHGIDDRNYRHYKKMANIARKHCGIGVVELQRECKNTHKVYWSGALLINSFEKLGDPIPAVQGCDQGHMIYWPRSAFSEIATFSACELVLIHAGKQRVDLSIQLETVFNPATQLGMF